ncbi:unnamed protein product [Blepharisma stoltei]|uniref:Ribosomal protein L7 n=1 Tax=Blepharisma stoltei TaxID=1481888 RepID=A0AAU9IQ27_9CILI|nr:unnamed protein product [Blepharisma stoltei]
MKTISQLKAESKPETLLRKRERADDERIRDQITKEREEQMRRKKERVPKIKSIGSFIASQRTKNKSEKALLVRMKRKYTDIPSDGQLIFAIRIHISVNAANPIKKALNTLRLTQRYTGIFLICDEATQLLLKTAEPFITFGNPSPALIDKLIRKRAKVMKDNLEIPLKDNTMVEDALGEAGVLCIDDIIHEISHPAENFSKVTNFLCPFKLNVPPKQFLKTPFNKGGDYGFRAEQINDVIEKMT